MSDTPPQGKRFTHVYLEKGEPEADSVRARRRISSLLVEAPDTAREDLGGLLQRELGVELPTGVYGIIYWHDFFAQCSARDVLDSVTLIYQHFARAGRSALASKWLSEVSRIFREENLRYRLDLQGGVHFSVDEEFERSRAATIAVLEGQRYVNALNEFERAYTELAATPPNGKIAVRSVFSATEGLFRLMFPSAPRLGTAEIDKHLAPLLQRMSASDKTASSATVKLISSFKNWVDAAHFYRHEPGKEEIAQPPLPLAINLIGLGASFIRWLAEIDAGGQRKQ